MDIKVEEFERLDFIKKMIKSFLKKHYSLNPSDADIMTIMNKAHEERKIGESLQFVLNRVQSEILVLYSRDQSILDKLKRFPNAASVWKRSIPAYLERAEDSYIKGNSTAGIFFCRLAIEMALRDKLLVKEARKIDNLENAKKILSDKMFGELLCKSVEYNILNVRTINIIFRRIMTKGIFCKKRENILNKFIHGDFIWLKEFIEKERKINLADYEKDKEIIAAHPDIISNFLFIDILKATYGLINELYF